MTEPFFKRKFNGIAIHIKNKKRDIYLASLTDPWLIVRIMRGRQFIEKMGIVLTKKRMDDIEKKFVYLLLSEHEVKGEK